MAAYGAAAPISVATNRHHDFAAACIFRQPPARRSAEGAVPVHAMDASKRSSRNHAFVNGILTVNSQ